MTLSPRDDEPDDHARRAEASGDPVGASGTGADGRDAAPPDERSGAHDDDRLAAEAAAWEAIVAHYGDAPTWDGPADPARGTPHPDHPAGRGRTRPPRDVDPTPGGRDGGGPVAGPDEHDPDAVRGPEERFVPPPAPPLPRTSPARGLAWFGLLGVPAVVLVLLVASVALPTWVGIGFVAWFVGGFVFLVVGMRTEHDDPDDGAVV